MMLARLERRLGDSCDTSFSDVPSADTLAVVEVPTCFTGDRTFLFTFISRMSFCE